MSPFFVQVSLVLSMSQHSMTHEPYFSDIHPEDIPVRCKATLHEEDVTTGETEDREQCCRHHTQVYTQCTLESHR